MLTVPGYAITETIARTEDIVLSRAEAGGRRVILRAPQSEYPTRAQLARLRYGHEIAASVDDPGVLKALAIERHGGAFVVVHEDFAGLTLAKLLAEGELPLAEALKIAAQIARALDGVHRSHVIHRGLEPANILVDRRAGRVKLVDFDGASRLSRESPSVTSPGRMENNLAYISPEQTGRMNRAVDHRTDLYSLGAVLYEMLVGKPPFRATDPMALVHSHIAIAPAAPHLLRPLLPLVLSDVILKLLAKNAEDRYRSAYGLMMDLEECAAQLSGTGTLAEIPLGRHDVSATLQIAQKLYGREDEARCLLDAFDRAAAGTAGLVLVSGYSGIGKSALVNEVQRPIVDRRGYFAAGKFDQLKNAPYGALIQVFQQLVRQLLAESEAQIAAWKERLTEAFGPSGRRIADMIPEIELIVGPQAPAPALEPSAAQLLFDGVLQRFVRALASKEHPLALFFDDLQWADSASLRVLRLLLKDAADAHLLVIGAYRDSEVRAAHPLALAIVEMKDAGARVDEISLRPLDVGHVEEMVADSLAAERGAETRALAALVFGKTEGSPFFVNQFLTSLYAKRLLEFDPELGRFRWDLDRVRGENITDNVATLMTERLRELSAPTRRALELAACVGDTFDLSTLSAVSGRSSSQTAADLIEAAQQGLVFPVDDAYKYALSGESTPSRDASFVQYRFAHDRVQAAAYAELSASAWRAAHHALGRLLLERTPEAEREARIFDIVNQLDLAIDLVDEPEARSELARLNLAAGLRAKRSTAWVAAARYFDVGLGLLAEDSWEKEYALAFALHRERAECEYLLGRDEHAEAAVHALLGRARTKAEKIDIYRAKMVFLHSQSKYAESIAAGFEGLKIYGIVVPAPEGYKAASDAEIRRLVERLAAGGADALARGPEAASPDARARAIFLSWAVVFGSYLNPDLYQLLAAMLLNHSLEHGDSPGSSIGYVVCAIRLGTVEGDWATAHALGRAALTLAERFDDLRVRSIVHSNFGMFLNSWRRPVRSSYAHLEQAYAGCMDTGELVYGCVSAMQRVLIALIAGDELGGLLERSVKHFDYKDARRPIDIFNFMATFQRFMLLMMKGAISAEEGPLVQEDVALRNLGGFPPTCATHHLLVMMAAYLFGDLARALEAARRAGELIFAIFGHIMEVDYHFYRCLILFALLPAATVEERARHEEAIALSREKLRGWAEGCPENFLQKHLLVAAEAHAFAGQNDEAMDLYTAAVEAAAKNEAMHDLALANERSGEFCLARGWRGPARAHLEEARYAYARWGAEAKAAALGEKHKELLPGAAFEPRYGLAGGGALDLIAVMRASRAISGEIVLSELMKKLMTTVIENAGARRGLLLLKGETGVAAQAEAEGSARAPAEGKADYPRAIVRYVERTGEAVVLGDAAGSGQFRADEYVARTRTRSILCLPILKQKEQLGVLYLENGPVADAFTPERCEVLALLAAQAAVSLENARLYDTLEQRVQARTRELEESHEELSSTLRRLKETQKRLVMQEKLASLGALTSGIAHEIKNPLNFVNNFAQLSVGLADELRGEIDRQEARLEAGSAEMIREIVQDLQGNVAKINSHGKRADRIVRSMLEHSRTATGERREVDVNALFDEYVSLAYQGLRAQSTASNVTIEKAYDPAVRPLELAPQEIGRVLLNLFNNAYYAATARARRGGPSFAPTVRVSTRELGSQVELRVRDNGDGVPEAMREKIWNPFFTTKPPGEGTGLGLSISFDIVVQGHGGTLALASEEGRYAEFVITLPRRSPGAQA